MLSVRLLPGALLTLACALCAAPSAQAQTLNLGRILRDAIDGAGCDTYKRWLGDLPERAGPGRNAERLLPLVEDEAFAPVFGKRYRELTADDFRKHLQQGMQCRRTGQLTPVGLEMVSQVFNQHFQQQLLQQQQARQVAQGELSAVRAELAALQPTAADADRIDALRQRGEAALRRARPAAPADLAEFAHLVEATRLRVRLPVETEEVRRLVAEAEGAQGLQALANQADRLGRSGLPATAQAPLREQLDAKVAALAADVAVIERRQLPPLAGDLPALGRHAAALRELAQRYGRVAGQAPALAALQREQREQRAPLLPAAMTEAARQARQLRDLALVTELPARYFLADEMDSGGGTELRAVVEERSRLLKRLAADTAIFGPQPEHERLLAGLPAAAPAAAKAPATPPTRCDQLAAHPLDPEHNAPGVPDDRLEARAALTACQEAVRAAPQSGRLHFQLARALLDSNRVPDALAELRRAAELKHAGAHFYLAEAYKGGAPGLAKNAAQSQQYAQRAADLGWGGAPAGGSAEPTFNEAAYEDVRLVRAFYYGDSSQLGGGQAYINGYAIGQAGVLAQECKSFKLSELDTFRANIMRSQLPGNQGDLMRMALERLGNGLAAAARTIQNPRFAADTAEAEQRVANAPDYGMRDIAQLAGDTGGCKGQALQRYARNLRAFLVSR